MKIKDLIKLLQKEDPEEDIYIWRGNGHPNYDYSSNLELCRPYGTANTNNGLTRNPLILTNSYKKDGD